MAWAFPSVQSPVVNPATGVITSPWLLYLRAFWDGTAARGEALEVQSVGASPWTYQGLRHGSLVVAGGTVTDISLVRKSVTISLGLIQGTVPVQQGDGIIITYAVLPNVTFIPD